MDAFFPGSFPPCKATDAAFDDPTGALLTTEKAAAYVGVHPDTLRKWIRVGNCQLFLTERCTLCSACRDLNPPSPTPPNA